MAAVMTYDMSNTDKLAIDIQEVKRLKIDLIPPCVNTSGVDFTVKNNQIFYALSAIKNVGGPAMEALVSEREKNGVFKDIYDFARRLDSGVMNKRTLEFLVKSGALDCFTENRRQILESLDLLVAEAVRIQSEKRQDKIPFLVVQMKKNKMYHLRKYPIIQLVNVYLMSRLH